MTRLDRIVPVALGAITPTSRNVLQMSYDGDDNVTSVTLPNSPIEQHDFAYTPVDDLMTYTPPVPSSDAGPGPWSTAYQYFLDHDPELETRPDGTSIAKDYDTAGRLWHVTTPQGVTTHSYVAATGQLQSIARRAARR